MNEEQEQQEQQQQQQQSHFFEIDNGQIRLKSAKPRHLERRLLAHASSSEQALARAEDNRAALMAERKAKLADHLGHVHGVCNKHKSSLIQQRTQRRTVLNDALTGAERNRQQLVTERRSQSAKVYRHAKEVAESQHRRDRLTTLRRRRELEDKLRSTRWRREQILKVGKSQLTDGASVEEALRRQAARAIQTWWRHLRLAKSAAAWKRLDFSLASLRAMPFPRAAEKVQSPAVIKATSRLLLRLKMSSPTPPPPLGKTPARVFLSSFMLLAHTSVLVENPGGRVEMELLSIAKTMVDAFEELVRFVAGDGQPPPEVADTAAASAHPQSSTLHTYITHFVQYWFQFHAAFEAYKKHDTQVIINGIIGHYLDLLRLLQNVLSASATHSEAGVPHEVTDAEYRPSIEKQLDILKTRLRNVGGDEALQQLRQTVQEQGLSALLPTGALLEPVPEQPHTPDRAQLQSLSTPPTLDHQKQQHASSDGPTTPSKRPHASLATPRATPGRLQAVPATATPSPPPPPPPSVTDLGSINEQLAHELIMNPSFRLSDEITVAALGGPEAATAARIARQVKQVAQRAFFDRVKILAERGELLPWLPELIGEIRDLLLGLVVNKGPTSDLIAEALDTALIAQQIRAGVFGVNACLRTVVNFMLQLAMPARDPEIRALTLLPSVEAVLQRTLELLETMKLDLANYNLQMLRPYLVENAVKYESRKFAEQLAKLPAQQSLSAKLPRTHTWLAAALEQLMRTPRQGIRFEEVYHEALLTLLCASVPATAQSVPEVLSLDVGRLFDLQNEVQALCVVAALVMLSKNTVVQLRSEPAAVAKLAALLLDQLSAAIHSPAPTNTASLASLTATIISVSNELLLQNGATLSPHQEQLITQMVAKTVNQRDAVYSLIQRRVHAFLRFHLNASSPSGTQVPVTMTTTAGVSAKQPPTRPRRDSLPSLVSSGLDCVEKQLGTVSGRVNALAKHNKAVHARWIDELIRTVEQQQQQQQK
ncbi:hypothetical protein RI367_008104 [Sorochytrium milnesiophthora]